jgi:myo-inositol 2-dehydrogenase/D-chiro-inositol 1-dehydrogenase
MKTVGIGIIGCGGRISDLVKRLLKQSERVKIVALCDPRPEALDRFSTSFNPDAKQYSDYRQLVKDPAVDWVMVGSWNCFH